MDEQVTDTTTMTVRTFRHGTDKEAALKPLEEAAEVYAAWQLVEQCEQNGPGVCDCKHYRDECEVKGYLADELADTITACANLAARYGLDLQAALDRVERRNRERGRYQ